MEFSTGEISSTLAVSFLLITVIFGSKKAVGNDRDRIKTEWHFIFPDIFILFRIPYKK